MINSLSVTNYIGESIDIDLFHPEKTGFAITSIDGLGPVKGIINTTSLANSDGSLYSSAKLESRNIVISVRFFGSDIEELRHKLYRYFPVKKNITILITTDTRKCATIGYVESNEPDIFDREESSQISIICPDSYFHDPIAGTLSFSSINKLLEFPFENNSLDSPKLEFGSLSYDTSKNIHYNGDSETGVIFTLHALGDIKNVTIYNLSNRESMFIDTDVITSMTGKNVGYGDDIVISTIKGHKYILLYRDGVYVNILNCLTKQMDWFSLKKGDNVFAFNAEIGKTNIELSIKYDILYEGV